MSAEENLYRKIGFILRKKRKEKSLTQEALAAKVGLTRTSITNIENGTQKIQLHNLYSIASVLKIEIYEILPRIYLNNDSDEVISTTSDEEKRRIYQILKD